VHTCENTDTIYVEACAS